MSAYVAIRKSKAVELLSDAAACRSRDGVVMSIASKITIVPGMICAIASKGPMVVHKFGGALEVNSPSSAFGAMASVCCRTFDEVVDRFDEVLGLVEALARALFPGPHEMLIAGWSESRNRPETYSFMSTDSPTVWTTMAAADRGSLQEAQPMVVAGSLPPWERVVAHGWSMPDDEDRFDPDVDGLAILEAMRHEPMPSTGPHEPEAFRIGGFVELVTVNRDGVSREIIRRWPDRVGMPIVPQRAPDLLNVKGN